MGIFSRLNTVIKSNLNSLVDKAEDPEKLISQTIVDMEAELKKARRELVGTLGAAKRLEKKRIEHEDEAASWEDKAVLALRQDDEELAREALRRKARALKEVQQVRRQANLQAAAADEMKDTLERIEDKIEDLKARKTTLAAQVRKARDEPSTGGSRFGGASAFDDLERMAGQIDQLDAEVEVSDVLDAGPNRAELEAKFRKLERESEGGAVDDELAALKQKLDG
jgi:phage shock protein A